jgi:DNA polymerase-3 subunit delta'
VDNDAVAGFPAQLNVVGHDLVRDHLTQTTASTLLFVGPPNVGRRTTALWWFAYLNCGAESKPCGTCPSCKTWLTGHHPDLLIKAPLATTRSGAQAANPLIRLDQIALRRGPGSDPDPVIPWLRTPPGGKVKMAVISDADKMTEAAANAFLKTLEEPPSGSKIVLIAASRSAVLPTVASRAELVRFGSVPVDREGHEPVWRPDVRYGRLGAVLRSRAEGTPEEVWRTPVEAVVEAMKQDTATLLEACEGFVEAERKVAPLDLEGFLIERVRNAEPSWVGPVLEVLVDRRDAKAAYVSQRTLATHLALSLSAIALDV